MNNGRRRMQSYIKNRQLTLFDSIEAAKQEDKPYFNALGEPLPWEEEKLITKKTKGFFNSNIWQIKT